MGLLIRTPSVVELDRMAVKNNVKLASENKPSSQRIDTVSSDIDNAVIEGADGAVDRLRKYIPVEVLAAWTTVKGIETAISNDEKQSVVFDVLFGSLTGVIAILTPVWVYIHLTIEERKIQVKETKCIESSVDCKAKADAKPRNWPRRVRKVGQAIVSMLAFMLFAMSLGEPFVRWGMPQYLPLPLAAVFLLAVGTWEAVVKLLPITSLVKEAAMASMHAQLAGSVGSQEAQTALGSPHAAALVSIHRNSRTEPGGSPLGAPAQP